MTREVFTRFKEAALRAKALAIDSGQIVQVFRIESGWVVSSRWAKDNSDPSEHEDDFADEQDREEEEEQDREQKEQDREEEERLVSKIASDRDDWARSEEAGWYYSDDDE